MNRTQTIEEFIELHIIVALGTRLVDGCDKILWSTTSELSRPQGLLPVTMIVTVMAVLVIVIALVTVIVASFIGAFVSVTCWAIRSGNPGGVFTMA
jgi:hypothetical protein